MGGCLLKVRSALMWVSTLDFEFVVLWLKIVLLCVVVVNGGELYSDSLLGVMML